MNDPIEKRIRLLYLAIDQSVETDMRKLPATFRQSDKAFEFRQDFSGGKSSDELELELEQLISEIAHLKDPLKHWADRHGQNPQLVEDAVNNSPELSLVVDLSNTRKHAKLDKPPRSGRKLEVRDVRRNFNLVARSGEWATFTQKLRPGSTPEVTGDGSGVILAGEIYDLESKELIAYVGDVLDGAVKAWESLLKSFNIALPTP